jgi:hypothetical protein
MVAVVDFLVIRDGDIRSHECVLVVVESLSEGRQVFDGVFPFCVVCRFEFFLRLHVEGAPASVEVLEDLVWCDVTVRRQSVAELGIKLLVKCIS